MRKCEDLNFLYVFSLGSFLFSKISSLDKLETDQIKGFDQSF
jgi:hypothetical protein